MPRPQNYRPHIPLKVKVEACLIGMGLDPRAVEWDHDPPLALRPWDEDKQDTDPPANDPRFITPRVKEDHREKTKTDVGRIAKAKRLSKAHEDMRRRLTSREGQENATVSRLSHPTKRKKLNGEVVDR